VTTLANFYARVRSTFTSSAISIIITLAVRMAFLMKKELFEPAARGKKPVLSIFLIDRRC